jgi:hypothetical protein
MFRRPVRGKTTSIPPYLTSIEFPVSIPLRGEIYFSHQQSNTPLITLYHSDFKDNPFVKCFYDDAKLRLGMPAASAIAYSMNLETIRQEICGPNTDMTDDEVVRQVKKSVHA